jgi:epoxyqueuosine reductase
LDSLNHQKYIEDLCLKEGFTKVGFAKTEELDKEAIELKEWLEAGYGADMKWMNNSYEKRINSSQINPRIRSVISLAYLYDTPVPHPNEKNIPYISRYAWGKRDYHKVIKKKLKSIVAELEINFPVNYFRYYVDDGPVMDKVWAVRAGLGWMGKNTTVINPDFGSFFFIANIFTDLEFSYAEPIEDKCKSCTVCLTECPTGAIFEEYKLDANKCISYQTIENRCETLPDEINLKGWVFGCDICQDVCPFNQNNFFTTDDNFFPRETIVNKTYDDFLSLSEEQFNSLFEGTPVRRAKYKGFIRNLRKAKSEQTNLP